MEVRGFQRKDYGPASNLCIWKTVGQNLEALGASMSFDILILPRDWNL